MDKLSDCSSPKRLRTDKPEAPTFPQACITAHARTAAEAAVRQPSPTSEAGSDLASMSPQRIKAASRTPTSADVQEKTAAAENPDEELLGAMESSAEPYTPPTGIRCGPPKTPGAPRRLKRLESWEKRAMMHGGSSEWGDDIPGSQGDGVEEASHRPGDAVDESEGHATEGGTEATRSFPTPASCRWSTDI